MSKLEDDYAELVRYHTGESNPEALHTILCSIGFLTTLCVSLGIIAFVVILL